MRTVILSAILSLMSVGAFADDHYARAKVYDQDGKLIGRVSFFQYGERVVVNARVYGLTPGFHGFHVHAVGKCEAGNLADPANRPFTSAGPHFDLGGNSHRDHSGDMPVLLATKDGKARAAFSTDRFSIADLLDQDGSAVIVHANPDNYANIPTDRYTPAPDATTLATGDAGGRTGCGVVTSNARPHKR